MPMLTTKYLDTYFAPLHPPLRPSLLQGEVFTNIYIQQPCTPPPSGGRLGGGHRADGVPGQLLHSSELPPSSPPPAGGR